MFSTNFLEDYLDLYLQFLSHLYLFRISLKANFKLLDRNNILIKEYNFEPSAIYSVADNYSQNLDREKQTIDILIREIEKEILDIFKNDL